MILGAKTLRACQVCGKPFYGSDARFYCPDCAKAKKLDTVIKIRTCQDCGVEFFGGPRARRCPACARKAKQETDKKAKKRGVRRPLGSIDKCEICGMEYTVTSGRQKYCSEYCQRKGTLEWQKEHKKGYNKKSGQDIMYHERKKKTKKICAYCLREFSDNTCSNLCSDYCRSEQRKINQCKADIKRGYNRDLEKYKKAREDYRKKVGTDNNENRFLKV